MVNISLHFIQMDFFVHSQVTYPEGSPNINNSVTNISRFGTFKFNKMCYIMILFHSDFTIKVKVIKVECFLSCSE